MKSQLSEFAKIASGLWEANARYTRGIANALASAKIAIQFHLIEYNYFVMSFLRCIMLMFIFFCLDLQSKAQYREA